jgi:hypothetical protein
MRGVELAAYNLFRIFSGLDGPASEFEFHTGGTKAHWMRLARHILSGSLPQVLQDPIPRPN